jgi:hypothetical protein
MHTTQLTINDYPVFVTFTYDEDYGFCIETVEAHLPGFDTAKTTHAVDVSPLLGLRDFDALERQIAKHYDRIVAGLQENEL